MSSIDERIVMMKFENHLFEKNAQTTISTLDKLKSALNFNGASKGLADLEKSANSMNFNSLSSSVDLISKRFSTMGIAGATVIQDLTQSALNLGKTLARSVIDPIKSGGWTRATNIDQAKFKLEGLNVAWEKIYEDINYGVDQTAYGLDSAASAAAQLVASGVEYGEVFGATGNSPMAKALKGISGVAAMTSSSYDEISSIFVTVAGQGKVMTQQLRQLENRGLNAAAQLGHVLGKTEAEIRDMVTKGQIDFETFSSAMYEAFGEHASKANETFEGSLANMKSALGRIGANFATPFRKNMTDVFNAIRPLINELNKVHFTQIYRDFEDFAAKASGFIVNVLGKVDLSFIDNLVTKVHNAYTEFDNLMSSINPLWKAAVETEEETVEATEKVTKAAYDVEEIAKKVLSGEYGNGDERRKKLEEEGYLYEEIQNKVNELLGNTKRYEVQAEEAAEATEELNKEEKKQGNLLDTLNEGREKYNNKLGKATMIEEKAGRRQQRLSKIMSNLYDTISGVSSAFNILKNTGKAVIKGAIEPLTDIGINVASIVTSITGAIGRFFTALDKLMTETGAYEKIQSGVNHVLTGVADVFGWIADAIERITSGEGILKSVFGFLSDSTATNSVNGFGDAVGGVLGKINEFIRLIGGCLISDGVDGFSLLLEEISDLYPVVSKLQPILFEVMKNITLFNGTKAINSVFKSINIIPKILKAYANDLNGSAIMKLGIAFGLLAGSLFLLSQLTWDKLAVGVVAIVAVTAALGGLWAIFTKLNQGTGKYSILKTINGIGNAFANNLNATAILKVAGAFGILSASLFALSHLTWDQLKVGVVALAAVTAALSVLMFVYSKTMKGGKKMKSISATLKEFLGNLTVAFTDFIKKLGTAALLTSIGIAVALIGMTVVQLSKIPVTSGIKALGFLAIMFIELRVMLGSMKTVADGFSGLKLGVFMAVLALVLKSIGKTLKALSEIPFLDGLKGLAFLGIVFAELGLALTGLKKVADGFGGFKLAAFMVVLALVMKSMSKTLEKLSGISFADGLKGLTFLGIMFVELGIALKALKKIASDFGGLKLAAFMVVLTLVVGGLSNTLIKLGKLKFEEGIKGLLLLGGMFAIMLATLKVGSKMTTMGDVIKIAIFLAAFTGAIGTVSASIVALSKLNSKGINQAIKAIGAISTVLIAVIAASKYMNSNTASSIKNIAPMIIALAGFTAALYILSNIDAKKLDASTKALTSIIRSLSLFSLTSKNFGSGNLASTIANFVGIGALIAEIAGIFYLLQDIDTKQMLTIADSMSELMVALGALSLAASKLGGNGVDFLSTLSIGAAQTLNLDILLANVVVIEALAAFVNEHFPGFKNFLDSGLPLIEKVGEGIGRFLGAIIENGLLKPIKNTFTGIGDGLTTFLEKLMPFLNGTADIPEDAEDNIEKLKDVFSALGDVAWEGLIANIKTYFFGATGGADSLSSLMEDLTKEGGFLDQFDSFKNKISSVDDTANDGIDNLSTIFEKLGNVAAEGTLANIKSIFWDGGTSLISIIEDLTKEGGFIEKYNALEGSLSSVTGDTSGLQNISKVFEELGNSSWEGFKANIKANFFMGVDGTGTDTLVTLMRGLTKKHGFLNTFASFESELSKYSIDENAASNINSMKSVMEALGNTAWAGWVANIKAGFFKDLDGSGYDTLPSLMDGLSKDGGFIKSFGAFSTTLSEANITEDGIHAIDLLREAMKALGDASISGWVANIKANIFGDNGFSQFGDNLVTFARQMKRYSHIVSYVDNDAVTASVNSVTILSGLNDLVPKSGGLMSKIFGDKNLGKFGDNIKDLGEGLVAYDDAVNEHDFSNSLSSLENVKSLLSSFNEIISANYLYENGELTQALINIGGFVDYAYDSIEKALSDNSDKFISVGETMFGYIIKGMLNKSKFSDEKESDLNSIITTITSSLTDEAATKTTESAGNTVMSTFIEAARKVVSNDSTLSTDTLALILKVIDDSKTLIESQESKFTTAAETIVTAVNKKISDVSNLITDPIYSIFSTVMDIMDDLPATFGDIGANTMYGMAQGIQNASWAVVHEIIVAANDAENAARRTLRINSPSKVFAEIGSGTMEGFALGVKNSEELATSKIMSAGRSVADKMGRALDSVYDESKERSNEVMQSLVALYEYINSIALNEIDANPRITPVLDLSSFNAGTNTIRDAFRNGNGYNIGYSSKDIGSISYQLGLLSSSSLSSQLEQLNYAVTDLSSKVNSLRDSGEVAALGSISESLDKYLPGISNKQVVLDSGEVVGALTPRISKEMRAISNRSR